MLFADIDAAGWALIGGAIVAAIGAKVLDYVQMRDAARKVETVKNTLEANTASTENKLDALAKVADSTHTLVNSNMSIQVSGRPSVFAALWRPSALGNASCAEYPPHRRSEVRQPEI